MSMNDPVDQLLDLVPRQAALEQEVKDLKQALGQMAAADLADQLERAMQRFGSRRDDTGPPAEQVALIAWFGEMRERLGHADPSFYLSVLVDPDPAGDVRLEGSPLAFADSVRIGQLDLDLKYDAETTLRVSRRDLAAADVVAPAEIVVLRDGRPVGRGVLPAV